MTPGQFKAPWDASLKAVSLMIPGVLVLVAITGKASGEGDPFWIGVLALAILGPGLLFTIKGYEVRPDAILVRRLLWSTRISLTRLVSVRVEPLALRAFRVFGNGGLFAFSGWFYSKNLKWFRAFATSTKSTVVLEFTSRRIVVSPQDPERFVSEVSALIPNSRLETQVR